MKKKSQDKRKLPFIILTFSFFWIFFSKESFSYPTVVSANGFFCSRSQSLVTCQGQFPNLPGTFTSSGFHFVQFTYESLNFPKVRYFYDSTNGCLMQIHLSPTSQPIDALVKNARGISQKFSFPMQQSQANTFCKS